MPENQEEYVIYRKIYPKIKYRVYKNTFNDINYYKIIIKQKDWQGNEKKYRFPVTFKKNVDLPNCSDIIIKTAYENFKDNPKDPYNPICYLLITDFELIENQENINESALQEYQKNLAENENVPTIDDSALPF